MKISVAVFFGGKSVEHEVSIISGIQAFCAIDRTAYDAVPVYIDKENRWYTGEHMGRIESYKNMKACMEKAIRVLPVAENGRVHLIRHPAKKFGSNVVASFDVAMPVVHGTNVEDGTLMGMLEMLNIPYTGCDVLSSALGMDKYAMKAVLKQAGLPVVDALVFTGREYSLHEDEVLHRIEEVIGLPAIIKPVNLGSSIGISLAKDTDSLRRSMESAFEFSPRVLVEKAVQNLREINCAVLGDIDEAKASVCEEPVSSAQILDFNDKYISGGKSSGMAQLKRKLPADIPAEMTAQVEQYAVRTFQALGCSGVARIDFLNDKVTGELYVNEINTIPGSLAFYLWEATGMPFDTLLSNLIALAFKRQRERSALTFTYASNILESTSFGGAKGKA